MKLEIRGYWGAELKRLTKGAWNPEEVIKRVGHITVCSIVIDGKYLGDVTYDGNKLSIDTKLTKPREDLQP